MPVANNFPIRVQCLPLVRCHAEYAEPCMQRNISRPSKSYLIRLVWWLNRSFYNCIKIFILSSIFGVSCMSTRLYFKFKRSLVSDVTALAYVASSQTLSSSLMTMKSSSCSTRASGVAGTWRRPTTTLYQAESLSRDMPRRLYGYIGAMFSFI